MKNICLIGVLFFISSTSVISQKWRKIVTSKYQETVSLLDSSDFHDPVSIELPIILPLVFHLVYPKRNQAPSRDEVEWQVAQLNKHFSLEEFNEKSIDNEGNPYNDLAVDTEIRFCLDKIKFTPSDSIEFSSFNTIKDDKTKGAKPFKPEEFINIWVGELTDNSGFAQLPGGIWETDGIVIDLDYFGQKPAPYNEGKSLTHLIGNYLGLKDLWGNNNCEDDGVKDTPIHNAPNYNRVKPGENHISLCPGFTPEMYMNYMDNTVDSMLYMFTKGQKERMHSFLRNERNGLLGSKCSGKQIDLRSAENIVETENLKAFPNPLSDHITIQFNERGNTSATLEIFNIVGRLIHTEQIGEIFSKTFSVETWEPGIYIISVKGKNKHSVKIVKQ